MLVENSRNMTWTQTCILLGELGAWSPSREVKFKQQHLQSCQEVWDGRNQLEGKT